MQKGGPGSLFKGGKGIFGIVKESGRTSAKERSEKNSADRSAWKLCKKVFWRVYSSVHDGIYVCGCEFYCRRQRSDTKESRGYPYNSGDADPVG